MRPDDPRYRKIWVDSSFDDLLYALERASDKGYLPDAMVEAWEDFDYHEEGDDV